MARMYFQSILGATRIDDGWRCPRRKREQGDLVVEICSYLERKGWKSIREGIAQELSERIVERRRSFERARNAATSLREGRSVVDVEAIKNRLRDFGWNESARSLKDHQIAGLVHGVTAANAANFSVPGSGKTATTLALAALHLSAATVDLVVVVGPLSSFRPWELEAGLALPGKLHPRRIRGSSSARSDAYAEARQLDLLLLSYSTAARDRRQLLELFRRFNVMLVVDESHRIKRFRGGFWAPALVRLSREARVRVILSGTPMPQSGRDLYSQLNVLWPDRDLTGPPDDFATRISADFNLVLAGVLPFVSRTPKSALGLKPYRVTLHQVPLQGTEAEVYDLIESNFRRQIENAVEYREKIETLRRGRPIRLLQAATNCDLLNSSDSFYHLPPVRSPSPTLMERLAAFAQTQVPSKSLAAIELLRSIVEVGGKAVVWSNFLKNLDQFSGLVERELGIACFQIDGRVPVGDESSDDRPEFRGAPESIGETREQIIDRFLTSADSSVLVANPASCSESISLHTTCHNAIYLDRTYDCSLFLQSIDRVHRLGLPEGIEVQIHILAAQYNGRDTVDALVDASIGRKEADMRRLLEGAELGPFEISEDPLVAAQGDTQDLDDLLRFLLGEEGSS